MFSISLNKGITILGEGVYFKQCTGPAFFRNIVRQIYIFLPSVSGFADIKTLSDEYKSNVLWGGKALALIACLFCCTTASAYDFLVDGFYYNILTTNDGVPSVAVTCGSFNPEDAYSGDIVIPSEVTYEGKTYIVTEIEGKAFGNSDKLNSVKCPSTLKKIGPSAFWNTSLKKIELNEGLEQMSGSAFYDTELKELHIPSTVNLIEDDWSSNGCMDDFVPRTTKITVHPDNKNYVVSNGAFYTKDMKQLLLLPSANEAKDYGGLFVVPEGVETIKTRGNYSKGYYNKGFSAVVLPKSVKEVIGWRYGYLILQSSIPPTSNSGYNIEFSPHFYIPTGSMDNYRQSEYWEEYAKDGSLKEMVLDRDHEISLKTTLNSDVTVTVNGSTDGTIKVAPWTPIRMEISMPKDWYLSDILSWLIINGENVPLSDDNWGHSTGEEWKNTGVYTYTYEFVSVDDTDIDIAIGLEGFEDEKLPLYYKPNSPTSVIVGRSGEYMPDILYIPEKVEHDGKSWEITEIRNNGFQYVAGLKEVYIPGSVKTIGEYAFANINLETIHFSEGLQYIGSWAFMSTKLSDVELPQSLKECGSVPFPDLNKINYPSNLESFASPSYITYSAKKLIIDDSSKPLLANSLVLERDSLEYLYIGRNIGENKHFQYCKNLEEVTVGAGLTALQENMFVKCKKLKKVNVVGDELAIGGGAFVGCDNLEEVNIPKETHLTIGTGAFQYCSSLNSLVLPDRVDDIGHYALAGCESLSEITIPESVREIKNSVFYGCENLRTLNIKDSKEPLKISDTAFDECPLENLYYGRKIEEYHPTFFDTKTLKRVDIGEYVDELPSYTFGDCDNLTDIYCHNPQPPTLGKEVFRGVNKDECKLHLQSGGDDNYQNADTWKDFFDSSAIEHTTVSDDKIYSASGNIIIKGCRGEAAEISSVDGTVLYSQRIDSDMEAIHLPAGLYIVKVKDMVKKIINN